MKYTCPHCGTKYEGPRCPTCRRITDDEMKQERSRKIGVIAFILVLVVVAILLSVPWIVAKISMDRVHELTNELDTLLQSLF